MKTIPANGQRGEPLTHSLSKQQENIPGSITQLHPWTTLDKQYGDKLRLASDAFFSFNNPVPVHYVCVHWEEFFPSLLTPERLHGFQSVTGAKRWQGGGNTVYRHPGLKQG